MGVSDARPSKGSSVTAPDLSKILKTNEMANDIGIADHPMSGTNVNGKQIINNQRKTPVK